jgi:hypothetical protein
MDIASNANNENSSPAVNENDNGNVSPSTPSLRLAQPWSFTGDKLEDDLRMFTTGSFYDCTFKVTNDVTNESKVFSFCFSNVLSCPHLSLACSELIKY